MKKKSQTRCNEPTGESTDFDLCKLQVIISLALLYIYIYIGSGCSRVNPPTLTTLMQTPSDYFFSTLIYISGCGCSRVVLRDKVTLRLLKLLFKEVDVVEWSRALDIRLSEWCCSVSMVWVQIPSREEQKFDSSKI